MCMTNTTQKVLTAREYADQIYAGFRKKYPNGVVLAQHEQNGYHDSYFSETILDLDTGEIVVEQTGATAYGGPHDSGLPLLWRTDQAVQQKARIALALWARKHYTKWLTVGAEKAAAVFTEEAKNPPAQIGDKAVMTRKVTTRGIDYPKGTAGEIVWVGVDSYSGGVRYGIMTPSGDKVYVNHKSVVIDREVEVVEYVVSEQAIEAYVQKVVHSIMSDADIRRVASVGVPRYLDTQVPDQFRAYVVRAQ